MDAYNARDLTHQLAESLYIRGRRDEALAKAISPFVLNTNGANAAKQARLALRAATLRLPELRQFLDKCEPCVCLRAGETAKLGFKAHPHMLRHATGYALANAGHDTRALQSYLGHRNIQHTVKYTELAPTRFRDFFR